LSKMWNRNCLLNVIHLMYGELNFKSSFRPKFLQFYVQYVRSLKIHSTWGVNFWFSWMDLMRKSTTIMILHSWTQIFFLLHDSITNNNDILPFRWKIYWVRVYPPRMNDVHGREGLERLTKDHVVLRM
jgi:hypothetical protein